MRKFFLCSRTFFLIMVLLIAMSCAKSDPIIWTFDNTSSIGQYTPIIIGEPQIVKGSSLTALSFNGMNDGLIMPVNPVKDWDKFTIEVLFNPSADGNPEQRFVHFQDKNGNRGLIEIRLNTEGNWCLDTYLHLGQKNEGLTLIDRSKIHPCNEWYWAAMVYDGKTLKHFINAEEEISGDFEFDQFESGLISIGVRLNQVYWFKGKISEIRFHPKSLNFKKLQKVSN